jgi:enoyl-CoA hydratase/carnithine racemase
MANVVQSIESAVLTITIDKPPLNTLSSDVVAAIEEGMESAQTDEAVRAIVITGQGERAFSAGADISEFPTLFSGGVDEVLRSRHRFLAGIEDSRKPVIAALNGLTLGGGHELALACHFRLAAEGIEIGLPEIKLGIIPGWAGTQRLTRIVGTARALEIMLLGERIPADEALRIGLLHRIYPRSSFSADVRAFAENLAQQAPLAVAAIIESVNAFNRHGIEKGTEVEIAASARIAASNDAAEGIMAFMQKKKPLFRGR